MFFIRQQLTKIGIIAVLVLSLGVVMVYGQPVGSTFANGSGSGGLQLTIDSYSTYNGEYREDLSWELKDLVPGVDRFFNFSDIKPGDTGENSISIHVDESDAYVCMDFTNLVDDENGINEPESLVDATPTGDLSRAIEFFAWRDDGDDTFEVGERPLFGTSSQQADQVINDASYPLADGTTDEVFEEGETYYVGITWCAGDLVVDMDTAEISCDPLAMDNVYQTDRFTVDVSLRAVEVSNFTDFTCEEPGVDLYLNKHISGADEGFALSDFSYRIVGTDVDIVAPHDSFTHLTPGVYTIEELVPDGFLKEDWRIGWYGQCESGNDFTTTIEIRGSDIKKSVLYCEADNQYRPDHGDNEHSSDEDSEDNTDVEQGNGEEDGPDDVLSPGQQASGGSTRQIEQRTTQQWSRVDRSARPFERSRTRSR